MMKIKKVEPPQRDSTVGHVSILDWRTTKASEMTTQEGNWMQINQLLGFRCSKHI